MGDPAVALARSVAVLWREATRELAAAVADLEPAQAAAAADVLVAHEVLLGGETLAFVHPIVRTAVYSDFSPPLRGDAHRRAATLLSERGAELESVAAQIVAAPPAGDPWAVDLLLRAGAAALARGAPEAAVMTAAEASGGGPSASSNGSSSNTTATNNTTTTTTTTTTSTTTLTPPRVPGPTMALLGSRLRASRRGVIRLRLGCPAETPGGCFGAAGLQKGAAPRAFRAAAGATTTAKLKLTRSTRRRLSRRHRLRVTVAVTAHDGQGNEATSSGAYTVLWTRR